MSKATTEDSSAVGNAAALREALVRLRDIALASLEKKRREGVDTVNLAEIIVHHCEAALSAPARNCDRFCSIEQARAAYRAEVRNVLIWDGYESERFAKWLLALAAERKGDNDEQK